MNEAPALGRVLFLPLTAKKIVGFDFEEPFEDQRKALRGRLFERQHLHVVVVNAKESSVAFDVGFREVVVEKCVPPKSGALDLEWREIQYLFQNAERFILCKNARAHKVAYLPNKAASFSMQRRQPLL